MIDPLVDPVGHGGEACDALELMGRLGYERWVAQGGDWGALVSSAIGRRADPAELTGIHVSWAVADPAKLTGLGGPDEEEQGYLARLRHSSQAEIVARRGDTTDVNSKIF